MQLFQAYLESTREKSIRTDADCGYNVAMWMFHATADSNVNSITVNGFKVGQGGTAFGQVWGRGIYFGGHISTALRFAARGNSACGVVLVCRVVHGQWVNGGAQMTMPPKLPATRKGVLPDEQFDSMRGVGITGEDIWVIPDSAAVYPAYILSVGL